MPGFIPIPGASKWKDTFLALPRPISGTVLTLPSPASMEHVKENAKVVELTEDEMRAVNSIISICPTAGERYHPFGMKRAIRDLSWPAP